MVNGNKIPHHIRMRDGSVFAFAGLWDHWEGEAQAIDSCTIIVMPASKVMKPIHERMPVIIAPPEYDGWLDSRVTDKQEIMQYLTSAPSSQLTAYPVSTWVNSPKNNKMSGAFSLQGYDALCRSAVGSRIRWSTNI